MAQQKTKITVDSYELKIVKDWYNSLLNRRELDVIITHLGRGTPDRNTIRNFMAQHLNIDKERIIIKKIESEFGWCRTKAHIHIYDTADLAQRIEPPHIIKRHMRKSEEESS